MIKTGNYVHIAPGVELGEDVTIGDFTIIHSGVTIGDRTRIGTHCVIGEPCNVNMKTRVAANPWFKQFVMPAECVIGEDSIINSHATIQSHVRLGKRFVLGSYAMVRGHASVGDYTTLATRGLMQCAVKVGRNNHFSAGTIITSSMIVKDGCFTGGYVLFSENKYLIFDYARVKGPIIENYVRIGNLASIIGDVVVGEYSIIGGSAIITKDVPPRMVAVGINNYRRTVTDEEVQEYLQTVRHRAPQSQASDLQ